MLEKLLDGKNALITGAYRNLGLVTAETLASYGANVIINDLDTTELAAEGKKAVDHLRAHGVQAAAIPADLSRSSGVRRLCREAIETFKRIDIVVNNAGPFNMDPYLSLKEEMWDDVMNVNLKAIYLTSQELAPQMKSNGWGQLSICAQARHTCAIMVSIRWQKQGWRSSLSHLRWSWGLK